MRQVVLLKSKWGSQGGLEKYAHRIAHAFMAKGAYVTILTTGNPPLHEPISFHSTKTVPWPGFVRLEQFDRFTAQWLKKNRADLIFGLERNRMQTHLRAGNGVHAAYLKTRSRLCHYNPLHRRILAIEKAGFENPSLQKLFTNSYMVRNEILAHYKTDPAKIHVIHNGVEWAEMEPHFSSFTSGSSFRFLFLGHGYQRKGLEPLLVGLSRLQNKDFSLTVIGKEKQIDWFKKRAAHLGLSRHVEFLGPVANVQPYYKQADCLVIPSFYDPFANVTVEALAMGLYVVSSKTNGAHEILTPQNGTVIEDLSDPESMKAALETAMNRPKTIQSARSIRDSVKHLDFPHQMRLLMDHCG